MNKEKPHDFIPLHPEVLTWIRLNESMTVSEAAEALEIDEKVLSFYEKTGHVPDYDFIERMVKVYHRPIGMFFLDKPIKDSRRRIEGVIVQYSDHISEHFIPES